jgi:hypothetical protein
MPRGRKSAVRYYFDSVTGSVIAVTKEGVRGREVPRQRICVFDRSPEGPKAAGFRDGDEGCEAVLREP